MTMLVKVFAFVMLLASAGWSDETIATRPIGVQSSVAATCADLRTRGELPASWSIQRCVQFVGYRYRGAITPDIVLRFPVTLDSAIARARQQSHQPVAKKVAQRRSHARVPTKPPRRVAAPVVRIPIAPKIIEEPLSEVPVERRYEAPALVAPDDHDKMCEGVANNPPIVPVGEVPPPSKSIEMLSNWWLYASGFLALLALYVLSCWPARRELPYTAVYRRQEQAREKFVPDDESSQSSRPSKTLKHELPLLHAEGLPEDERFVSGCVRQFDFDGRFFADGVARSSGLFIPRKQPDRVCAPCGAIVHATRRAVWEHCGGSNPQKGCSRCKEKLLASSSESPFFEMGVKEEVKNVVKQRPVDEEDYGGHWPVFQMSH